MEGRQGGFITSVDVTLHMGSQEEANMSEGNHHQIWNNKSILKCLNVNIKYQAYTWTCGHDR